MRTLLLLLISMVTVARDATAQDTQCVLEPQGVGVIIKASHHCMTTRGVHKPDTDLVTSRMLGCFRDNALTRQEFLGMAT